jgi:hypothetical protein
MDIIAGRISMMFADFTSAQPHVGATLRINWSHIQAIGRTTAETGHRLHELADLTGATYGCSRCGCRSRLTAALIT